MNTPSYFRMFCSLALVLLCQTGRAEMPDLQPIDFQVPSTISGPPGMQVWLTYCVTNRGDAPAVGRHDSIYLSTKSEWDESAVRVFLGADSFLEELSVENLTATFSLPVTNAGTYYLHLKVDGSEWLAEHNELNNQISRSFTFTPAYPDLGITRLQVPAKVKGTRNQTVRYSIDFTNAGPAAYAGALNTSLYWSPNPVWEDSDILLGSFSYNTSIPGGSILAWENTLALTKLTDSATGWIIARADFPPRPAESQGTNMAVAPFAFELVPPDLQPISLRLTNSSLLTVSNPAVEILWTLTNLGPGDASSPTTYQLVLSTNANLSNAVSLAKTAQSGELKPGGRYFINNSVTLPISRSGRYYLSLMVDPDNTLMEANEANNVISIPLDFDIRNHDLAVVPGMTQMNLEGPANPYLTLVWATTNNAPVNASNWNATVYFSTDPVLDSFDQVLSSTVTSVLAGGAVTHSSLVRLPVTTNGRYYLIEKADGSEKLAESNESNNTQVVAVDFTTVQPDLEPTALQAPALYTGVEGGSFEVAYTVVNHRSPAALDRLTWSDNVYASTNGVLDAYSIQIGTKQYTAPAGGLSAYSVTNKVVLPAKARDAVRLFVRIDGGNTTADINPGNNVISKPFGVVFTLPDAVPFVHSAPEVVNAASNPQFKLIWGVTNAGSADLLSRCTVEVYFSANTTLEAGQDRQLASSMTSSNLRGGAVEFFTNAITMSLTKSETGYLLFLCDRPGQVKETNETNNILAVPITFNISRPDLVVLSPAFPSSFSGPPEIPTRVVWGISNAGPGVLEGTRSAVRNTLYLSRNDRYDSWDRTIAYVNISSNIPPGTVAWFTSDVTLPIASGGQWHLLAETDVGNASTEVDESNNILAVPFTVNMSYADLAVGPLLVESELAYTPNSQVTVIMTATNVGAGTLRSLTNWMDEIWISRTPALDNQATRLKAAPINTLLAPGKSYAHAEKISLPALEPGTYYLLAVAGAGFPWDANGSNNVSAKAVNVQIERADLEPLVLTASGPSTVSPRPTFQFITGITNRSTCTAYDRADRYDAILLSRDAVLDPSDDLLASFTLGADQSGHTMLWKTNIVSLPVTESGTYYVFSVADYSGVVPESNESNNTLMTTIAVTVTPPDLSPIYFGLPATISGPPYPWVPLVYAVTNRGPGSAQGTSWGHNIYHAEIPGFGETLSQVENDLPSEGVYWRTNYVRLPFTTSGVFDVVFEVNPSHGLFESSYANNTITNRVVYTVEVPDLIPVRVSAPSVWTVPEDEGLPLSFCITNAGPGTAVPVAAWRDEVYLSSDPFLSPDDSKRLEVLKTGIVGAHQTYWSSAKVSFAGITPGAYYLIVAANVGGSLIESSTLNNSLAFPITINERRPDLVVQQLIVPTLITNPVSRITFAGYVMNQGFGEVNRDAQWSDVLALSSTPAIAYQPVASTTVRHSAPLPPGTGYWVTNTLPVTISEDGDYYFALQTGSGPDLRETTKANNALVVPVQVRLQKPDLVVTDVRTPAFIAPSDLIEVSWGITNIGTGATRPDAQVLGRVGYSRWPGDMAPQLASVQFPALLPGEGVRFTNQFELPADATNGLSLFFIADPSANQIESTRTNNMVIRTLPVTLQYPDLEVSIISYPTNLVFSPNQSVPFVYAVTNIGSGTARMPRYDAVTVDGLAGGVGVWYLTQTGTEPLAPGEGLWVTNGFRIPLDIGNGSAVLRLIVNQYQHPLELNWDNNRLDLPMMLEIRPRELAANFSILETNLTGTGVPSALVHWTVTNLGPGDFYPDFSSQISFSVMGASLPPALRLPLTNEIPSGTRLEGTNTIPLSWTNQGLHHLVMQVTGLYGEPAALSHTAVVPLLIDTQSDLALAELIAPAVLNGAPNQKVTVIARVMNQGSITSQHEWQFLLGLGSSLSGYNPQVTLFQASISNSLAPGASQWFTNVVSIPALISGEYRWDARVFPKLIGIEVNGANDVLQLPVQINLSRPSQLRVLSLAADAQATSTNPIAQIRWSVLNEGDGPPVINWVDSIYYSLDSQLSLDDTLVASRTNTAGLVSGANYSWQVTAGLPSDAKALGFLILVVDRDSSLWDDVLANNSASTVLRITPAKPEPAWLSEPRFINGRFQASLHGPVGQSVVLQVSTNLVDWESLRALTFQNEELDIEDTNSGGSAPRFYRLIPLSEME